MRPIPLLLFVFVTSTAMSQFAGFQAKVLNEKILIGEQTELILEITSAAADSVQFPFLGDTLISEIEVLEVTKIDTEYLGSDLSKKVTRQKVILTSFDSGYFAISPLKARVGSDTIESNPLLISVSPVVVDTSQGIYDIRDVADAPFSLSEWFKENWKLLASIFGLLALIIAAVIWLIKRPKSEDVEPKIIKIPAHKIAFERLAELEQRELWQKGKTKVFYTELTSILREYIENRFEIPALEQTSNDILRSMRMRPNFSQEQIEQTRQVLFIADLVKFAKENPVGAENNRNLERIKEFVQLTKLGDENNDDNG